MSSAKNRLHHLAMIMDGNRRWARQQSMDQLYTKSSAQAIFEAIAACKKHGVQHLSLYAFSLENSQSRDETLKQQVFAALISACRMQQDLFIREQVRVRFVGVRSLYPAHVLAAVELLEQATQECTGLQLHILFYYGGRQEIVGATAQIAADVARGLVQPEAINEQLFERYLLTNDAPSPELIIRTGGAQRLSNFLLYQAAYSELMFLDCLWPDVTAAIVDECIERFYAIERNFGR